MKFTFQSKISFLSQRSRFFFLFFCFFSINFFGINQHIFAQNKVSNTPEATSQNNPQKTLLKEENKALPNMMRTRLLDSGVEAKFPCSDPKIDTMHNADNSVMYVAECNVEKMLYSLVVLKTQNPASGTATEREYRLIFYANQFKTMLDIETCSVFTRDLKMPNNTEVVGVQYRCEDKNGVKYAIQGWVYGKQIVLYTVSSSELPENQVFQSLYNSVLFW